MTIIVAAAWDYFTFEAMVPKNSELEEFSNLSVYHLAPQGHTYSNNSEELWILSLL